MKNRTRKIICYTGIGARKNGIHTEKQFMKTIKNNNQNFSKLPAKNNVKGWVKWSGASYTTRKICKKRLEQNASNDKRRIQAFCKKSPFKYHPIMREQYEKICSKISK